MYFIHLFQVENKIKSQVNDHLVDFSSFLKTKKSFFSDFFEFFSFFSAKCVFGLDKTMNKERKSINLVIYVLIQIKRLIFELILY